MHPSLVLIDMLNPAGLLTSYKIRSTTGFGGLTIDRYRDIDRELRDDASVDVGGVRIYNSANAIIERIQSQLPPPAFRAETSAIEFSIEHLGVPLGRQQDGGWAMYNLVLPPGFRLRRLKTEDTTPGPAAKVMQEYVSWDTECATQLVELSLGASVRSARGWISFAVQGSAQLVAAAPTDTVYVDARESQWSIAHLAEPGILDDAGRRQLADELADKADWLELKPNFFGIGVNLNEVIKDVIGHFQKKVAPHRRTE
ncbi:MAG: hypothetical protein U0531_22645 [Dehalococcoidia bacterium]